MEKAEKEKFEHGTVDFNFATYPHYTGYGFGFTPHWHEEYEIIYVSDGVFHFIVDGEMVTVAQNQALILDRYAIHIADGHIPYADFRYNCFVFGYRFLFPDPSSKIAQIFSAQTSESQMSLTQKITGERPYEKEILEHLQQLDKLCQHLEGNELAVQIHLLSIFQKLLEEKAYTPRQNKLITQSDLVKKALLNIQQSFLDPPAIVDLADSLNISVNHFIRLFKTMVGSTPKQYIQNLRLHQALSLMKNDPSIPIAEIASRSGFDDNNYFSRVFKEKVGISPSHYLKSIENDKDS